MITATVPNSILLNLNTIFSTGSTKYYTKGIIRTIYYYNESTCNCSQFSSRFNTQNAQKSKVVNIFYKTEEINSDINYVKIFQGKFNAVFDGEYRFWVNSDNDCLLNFDGNKIFGHSIWTNINKFYDYRIGSIMTQWIKLTKDSKNDLQIYNAGDGATNHIKVGVEIKNESSLDSYNKSANNIYPIELIAAFPREVLFFKITTLDKYIFYKNNLISFDLSITDTQDTIFQKFQTYNTNILVNKFKLSGNDIIIPSDDFWNTYAKSYSNNILWNDINDIVAIKTKISVKTQDTSTILNNDYGIFICLDFLKESVTNFSSFTYTNNVLSTPLPITNASIISQNYDQNFFNSATFNLNVNDKVFTSLKFQFDKNSESGCFPKNNYISIVSEINPYKFVARLNVILIGKSVNLKFKYFENIFYTKIINRKQI